MTPRCAAACPSSCCGLGSLRRRRLGRAAGPVGRPAGDTSRAPRPRRLRRFAATVGAAHRGRPAVVVAAGLPARRSRTCARSTRRTGASTAQVHEGRIVVAEDAGRRHRRRAAGAVRRALPDREDGAGRRLRRAATTRPSTPTTRAASTAGSPPAARRRGPSTPTAGPSTSTRCVNPYVRGDDVLPAAERPLPRPHAHRPGRDPRRRPGRGRLRVTAAGSGAATGGPARTTSTSARPAAELTGLAESDDWVAERQARRRTSPGTG